MNIVEMAVNDLVPYENNPRKNDEAVDKVALSISAFGFRVPLVIDKNNVVVTGHTRLKSAKKLGMKEVPCLVADDLTEEQIKAFRLADNKVAEFSEWDEEKLMKTDKRVMLNYKWAHLNTRFEKCSAHWAQIALDEKGNVIYCCHKPYEIVGHIMDDDILAKYAAAHTDMSMCDIPCRMTAPNLVFDGIKMPVSNPQFI